MQKRRRSTRQTLSRAEFHRHELYHYAYRAAVLQRIPGAIEAALAGMMRAGEAIPSPIAPEADVVGPGEAFVFVSMRTADQVRAGWRSAP